MKLIINKIRFLILSFALSVRNTSSMRNRFLLAGVSLLFATACNSTSSQKHVSAQQKLPKTLVFEKNTSNKDSATVKQSNTGSNLVDEPDVISIDSTARPPDVMCYAPVINIPE